MYVVCSDTSFGDPFVKSGLDQVRMRQERAWEVVLAAPASPRCPCAL